MKIAFDITHPSDVHFFKNCIASLRQRGHEIFVSARDDRLSIELLRQYRIKFIKRHTSSGFINRLINTFRIVHFLYRVYRTFQPDLLIGGSGNIYIPIVAKILGKRSIIFDDTEHSKLQNLIVFRLATYICTPECYQLNIGSQQIRYYGSKELAYLHSNHYTYNHLTFKEELIRYLMKDGKNETVRQLEHGSKVILVRIAGWNAAHDLFKQRLINWETVIGQLRELGAVVIVNGYGQKEKISKHIIDIPVSLYHDLIAFSDIVISEGASTAAEAAVLGKPTVYCNTLKVGYINEYDQKYGLIKQVYSEDELLAGIKAWLNLKNLKQQYPEKRLHLLNTKIDVNHWMQDFILRHDPTNNRMKPSKNTVCFISNIDPRYLRIGGIETYLKELANILIDNDFHINIIGVSEMSKYERINRQPSFQDKLKQTGKMRFSSHLTVYFNNKATLTTSFHFLFHLLIKTPFMRSSNSDILHFQRPDFALPFVFRRNKKICTIHGNPGEVIKFTKSKWVYFLYQLFEKFTIRFFNKIIFVDQNTQEIYHNRYPHLKKKFILIPPYVGKQFRPLPDEEIKTLKLKYGFQQEDKILLYVGRLEKEKNVLEMVEMIYDFTCKNSYQLKLKFLIIGEGNLKPELKMKIENMNFKNAILCNYVPSEELVNYYNIADATLLFSHSEGMPLVVLESLACGTPVIAGEEAQLQDIISEGINGCIVNRKNFTAKLSRLLCTSTSKKIKKVPPNVYTNLTEFSANIKNVYMD